MEHRRAATRQATSAKRLTTNMLSSSLRPIFLIKFWMTYFDFQSYKKESGNATLRNELLTTYLLSYVSAVRIFIIALVARASNEDISLT